MAQSPLQIKMDGGAESREGGQGTGTGSKEQCQLLSLLMH